MKKSKTKFKEGFTLIEILITIAILGVIAGVVIVKLNHSRERARDNAVFSQIKSASTSIEACLLTNGKLRNEVWRGWGYTIGWFDIGSAKPSGIICDGDARAIWPDISSSWKPEETSYAFYRNDATPATHFMLRLGNDVNGQIKTIDCEKNASGIKCVKTGF